MTSRKLLDIASSACSVHPSRQSRELQLQLLPAAPPFAGPSLSPSHSPLKLLDPSPPLFFVRSHSPLASSPPSLAQLNSPLVFFSFLFSICNVCRKIPRVCWPPRHRRRPKKSVWLCCTRRRLRALFHVCARISCIFMRKLHAG